MRFATYKQLNLLKLKAILRGDPYLSFYHFNNINQAEWKLVKGKINTLLTSKPSLLKETELKKRESSSCKEKERALVEDFKAEPTRVPQLWEGENQVRFLVVNSKKLFKANPNKQVGGRKETLSFLERELSVQSTNNSLSKKDSVSRCWCGATPTREREYKRQLVERFFLDGPTLLVGHKDLQVFQNSLRELLKTKKLLFIGGFLENSKMNCLDLQKVISLNPFTEKKEIVNSLTHSLSKSLSLFNQPFYNLISILQLLTTLPKKVPPLEEMKAGPKTDQERKR